MKKVKFNDGNFLGQTFNVTNEHSGGYDIKDEFGSTIGWFSDTQLDVVSEEFEEKTEMYFAKKYVELSERVMNLLEDVLGVGAVEDIVTDIKVEEKKEKKKVVK